MVKGLVDKLKNTFRAGLIAGALAIGYIGGSGCNIEEPIGPKPIPNQKPVAVVTASPMSGYAPLPVGFDLSKSQDPDGGNIIKHKLFLGNEKDTTVTSKYFNYSYSDTGSYRVGAIAYDDEETASDTTWIPQNIVVGKTPNQKPVAQFTATPKTGYAPLSVTFTSTSYDVDGNISGWYWDFNNDGVVDDSSGAVVNYVYQTPGNYTANLKVKDNEEAFNDKKLETIVVRELVGQIAFWSNRIPPEGGYNEDIYKGDIVKTAAGKDTLVNITRITTNPGQDFEPSWSPDGKYLAFGSNRAGKFAVFKMKEDGSEQTNVTSNLVERAMQPHWGSNGKIVVAYRDKNDSEAGIGIIDLENSLFTSIYSESKTGNVPGWPKWSPDCTEIVFSKYDGQWDIWKMKTDKSGLTKLTNDIAVDEQPAWSPDGKKIIFMSDRGGTLSLYELNLSNSNITEMTGNEGTEVDPSYSINGNYIIFAHDLSSFFTPQVYIKDLNGTNWIQLTFDGANRYPSWNPTK